jgi:chromosome transmission fidelity protein 18
MALVSSPVAYPPSSSPPTLLQKRKRVEQPKSPEAKKRRIVGLFVDEDDDLKTASNRPVDIAPSPYHLHPDLPGNDTESVGIERDIGPSATMNCETTILQQSSVPKKPLFGRRVTRLRTCSGKSYPISTKSTSASFQYERLVADRSTITPGLAQKSYYGVEIHRLLDDARKKIQLEGERMAIESEKPSLPAIGTNQFSDKKASYTMWTEKYRARKFTDLVGDEWTHRSVLRWLKGWDSIVFPGLTQSKPKKNTFGEIGDERTHRKVLLLTGPPGLGKTTLAHVCARQAGYEVLEINASDERSKDVVKGRIRDAVGTENVKGVNVETAKGKVRKAGRPVCVIVDEVDGVVGGSGAGGEGGFMKALIDLVLLDQKNIADKPSEVTTNSTRKKKGDTFRLLRPLILICNDVYHPSLRPLRASSIAEIIHIRKPPLDKVVQRMKDVFEKEGIPSDSDAIRRLCESTWGLGGRKEGRAGSRGSGEGDIRGVLVAGEWIAHKLRSSALASSRLTRKWMDQHLHGQSSQSESSFHGLGRGGVREIVERVFLNGAGFPNLLGASQSGSSSSKMSDTNATSALNSSDLRKRHAISHLREMVDTTGDHDRCITECFSQYPSQTFQDDNFLSKPNAAYEWLHFHDLASSKVYSQQEWELTPYLSQSVVAFHTLFAAVGKHSWDSEKSLFEKDAIHDTEPAHPFSGVRADFAAYEAEKAHRATLNSFQSTLPAPLLRSFRSQDAIAIDLIPRLMRMLAPNVRPVVVGGSGESRGIASVRKESERLLVRHGAKIMHHLGVSFERARVESEPGNYGGGGWVFRMEP